MSLNQTMCTIYEIAYVLESAGCADSSLILFQPQHRN